MIELVPSITAQKLVVRQQQVKKEKRKERIQIYLGFNIKILFFFT